MSLSALATISLGSVRLPGTPMQWLWGFVVLSVVLLAISQSLSALARLFTECPHCRKVVRKAQPICHHCMAPIECEASRNSAERVVPRSKSKSPPRES